MNVLYIIIGLGLLVIGGEYLVRSSVGLSFKLNISKMVIGLTVVSFATSAPELLVSLQAALDGSPDISLGNVIGSNIANIGLVLGITAMIMPLTVSSDFYKLHWPFLAVFSILLYVFLWNDRLLSLIEGLALFVLITIFILVLIYNAKKEKLKGAEDESFEEVDDKLATVSYFKIFIWLLIGGVALYGGSELLVYGAKELAKGLGVSERIIAVTMVAVGTSVPELAASVIAALKKEESISIGNLIGSNIFNIGSVLGITSLIKPIPVTSSEILTSDIFWMLGFAGFLLLISIVPKKYLIDRFKGFIIFATYIAFVITTII